jgi:hypothetical protein
MALEIVGSPRNVAIAEFAYEFLKSTLKESVFNKFIMIVVDIEDEVAKSPISDVALKIATRLGMASSTEFVKQVESVLRTMHLVAVIDVPKLGIAAVIVNPKATTIPGFLLRLLVRMGRYIASTKYVLADMLSTSLAEDTNFGRVIDEIDATADRLPSARKTLKRIITNYVARFVDKAVMVGSAVLAINYFILLNTKPFPKVVKMCEALERHILEVCPYITAVNLLVNGLRGDIYDATDVPLDERQRLVNFIKNTYKELTPEIELPRFANAAHTFYTSIVARHPKDVYEDNPEKFKWLREETDYIWDYVRAVGVPVMDMLISEEGEA